MAWTGMQKQSGLGFMLCVGGNNLKTPHGTARITYMGQPLSQGSHRT